MNSFRVALLVAAAISSSWVLASTRAELAATRGTLGNSISALRRNSSAEGGLRCALVSSSGEMLAGRLGPDIEAHDVVVRFNAAPTEGLGRHVGNRTDVRLVSSPEASELVLSQQLVTPAVLLRQRAMEVVDAYVANGTVPIIVPECPEVEDRVAGSDPSTGFLGVLFFAHACSSVDLYGFIVRDLDAPYHYYGDLSRSQRAHFQSREQSEAGHKYIMERSIIEDHTFEGAENVLHVNVGALRRLCHFPQSVVAIAAARLQEVARTRTGAPSGLWLEYLMWPFPLG